MEELEHITKKTRNKDHEDSRQLPLQQVGTVVATDNDSAD